MWPLFLFSVVLEINGSKCLGWKSLWWVPPSPLVLQRRTCFLTALNSKGAIFLHLMKSSSFKASAAGWVLTSTPCCHPLSCLPHLGPLWSPKWSKIFFPFSNQPPSTCMLRSPLPGSLTCSQGLGIRMCYLWGIVWVTMIKSPSFSKPFVDTSDPKKFCEVG